MRYLSLLMLPAMAIELALASSLACPTGMYAVPSLDSSGQKKQDICFLLNPVIEHPAKIGLSVRSPERRQKNRRVATPTIRTTNRPVNPTTSTSKTTTTTTTTTRTSITSTSSPSTTTQSTSRSTTIPTISTTGSTSTVTSSSSIQSTTVVTSTTLTTTVSTLSTTTSSTTTSSGTMTSSSTTTSPTTLSTTTTSITTSSPTTTLVIITTTTTSTSSTTTVSTTLTSSTTTTTISTTSTTTTSLPAPTEVYVLQASGTGDFAVDGNFAQLQSVFGSGYRVTFSANRQNAQQFKFAADRTSLITSDGNLLAMVGGTANLHYVYFFPSTAAASALVNVNWEALQCAKNADNTLTCTGMNQSIFQVTQGETLLEIGDQNYGEQVTVNLIPVPGTIF